MCVCVSTGRGESTEAAGARCDDRKSLALKIELCSQHREIQERSERGGGWGGDTKVAEVKVMSDGGRPGH